MQDAVESQRLSSSGAWAIPWGLRLRGGAPRGDLHEETASTCLWLRFVWIHGSTSVLPPYMCIARYGFSAHSVFDGQRSASSCPHTSPSAWRKMALFKRDRYLVAAAEMAPFVSDLRLSVTARTAPARLWQMVPEAEMI
jgi:hypothetical protein